MTADVIARLVDLLGPAHILTRDADVAGYLAEPRGLYHRPALGVARPRTTDEVAAVLALCHETSTPVVPQGGNTGLVGGQVPAEGPPPLILSLARMNAIRAIDHTTNTMIVEAGVTLTAAHEAAAAIDRIFPLDMASAGSCTIGGNLATNAGGVSVIAFGTARDLVNGLEVVMADGHVLSNLSKLRKDNTGYDLKDLFIGSEGTLGVITAAVLRLHPAPRQVETALVGLASPAAALDLLGLAREELGPALRAFELMPRLALDFVTAAFPTQRNPLAGPHEWYVLIEAGSGARDNGLRDQFVRLLASAAERDVVADAVIAESTAQQQAIWGLREHIPLAQKHFGGSIKHDVSVPIAAVPAFLAEVAEAIERRVPGARLCAFGHLGDGNIHCNIQQPEGADPAAFLARWDEVGEVVHGLVAHHDGSISAEHGIGQLKRHLLPRVKDPVALATMRAIKAALDPRGILNPGKLL